MTHASVRRIAFGVVATLTAAAACDGSASLGPGNTAERTYVLHSVGGVALPYYVYATPAGDTLELLNETIALKAGGRGTRLATYRFVPAGGVSRLESQTVKLTYRIDGTEITVQPECGDDVLGDCAPPDLGTVSDAELRLLRNDVTARPVRVYTRGLDLF